MVNSFWFYCFALCDVETSSWESRTWSKEMFILRNQRGKIWLLFCQNKHVFLQMVFAENFAALELIQFVHVSKERSPLPIPSPKMLPPKNLTPVLYTLQTQPVFWCLVNRIMACIVIARRFAKSIEYYED